MTSPLANTPHHILLCGTFFHRNNLISVIHLVVCLILSLMTKCQLRQNTSLYFRKKMVMTASNKYTWLRWSQSVANNQNHVTNHPLLSVWISPKMIHQKLYQKASKHP